MNHFFQSIPSLPVKNGKTSKKHETFIKHAVAIRSYSVPSELRLLPTRTRWALDIPSITFSKPFPSKTQITVKKSLKNVELLQKPMSIRSYLVRTQLRAGSKSNSTSSLDYTCYSSDSKLLSLSNLLIGLWFDNIFGSFWVFDREKGNSFEKVIHRMSRAHRVLVGSSLRRVGTE